MSRCYQKTLGMNGEFSVYVLSILVHIKWNEFYWCPLLKLNIRVNKLLEWFASFNQY